MKTVVEICDVLNEKFSDVLAMPYAEVYLRHKAIRAYKGETVIEYELPAEDLEAIEHVMNLPDDVNKMFDDILDGSTDVM